MQGVPEPFFLEGARKLDDPFADLAWLREHRAVLFQESLGQWFGPDRVPLTFEPAAT